MDGLPAGALAAPPVAAHGTAARPKFKSKVLPVSAGVPARVALRSRPMTPGIQWFGGTFHRAQIEHDIFCALIARGDPNESRDLAVIVAGWMTTARSIVTLGLLAQVQAEAEAKP